MLFCVPGLTVGMLGVGADIPRDGAGVPLLTQMHHKCFPFLFQHKNAVPEHRFKHSFGCRRN